MIGLTESGDLIAHRVGAKCARRACRQEPATWWNLSTRDFYCTSCAVAIFIANGKPEGLFAPSDATPKHVEDESYCLSIYCSKAHCQDPTP